MREVRADIYENKKSAARSEFQNKAQKYFMSVPLLMRKKSKTSEGSKCVLLLLLVNYFSVCYTEYWWVR